MDELNEFYKKIQTYLMKKNQECGELQFLKMRATSESIGHIDDICISILNIFQTHSIPTKEKALTNNEKCVLSYTYLLLNTKFKNQERLGEDIVSGHLVDMCPPLSPYLFVQILWSLEYEKILIQSLLYMPVDLFTEVLDIVSKCIEELPFPKSLNTVYHIISITYTKVIKLKEVSVQSQNLEETIENLLTAFQEFLLLLTKPKFIPSSDLSNLKCCERYGIILKQLISTIRNCLEQKIQGVTMSGDVEKLLNITFGREPYKKCEDTLLEDVIATLNEHLMDLLSRKLKEITCQIYINWAEIDDEDNKMISLQRSIGNESYYLIECIKNNEQLSQNDQLIECLQHFSSKPDPSQSSFVLSLQELCCAISEGKKELMKELLCRYKEWDRSILDFVYTNKSLLENKDCLNLLEYLTYVLVQPIEEEFKELSYTIVTKILSSQNVTDIYEIVMMYLTKHDGKNHLESPHTEEAFNNFIARNSNLQISTNLKIVLLFSLKNLALILSILLKITIGFPRYENIMISAKDMLLLSPLMQIRKDNDEKFLTSILRTICLENKEWNGKKFMNFIKVALENSVIDVHDLMNNVFIPYLEEDSFNVSNINSVLDHIRKLQARCTNDTNIKGLTIALAKRMSFLRKSTTISKYLSNEIFSQITRILKYFLEIKSYRISASAKKEIIDGIKTVIEPIDKLHFASLWQLSQNSVSVVNIVEDYERRCFIVINRLKEDPKTLARLRTYLSDLGLLREDFLRHLILRSTEEEYRRLGSELTVIFWFAFGWNDELEAFNHFLRLTIEACCLSLEYPCIGGSDLFAFLLKSITRFCKLFVLLEGMNDQERVYESLIENFHQLDGSIKQSPYVNWYANCLESFDSNTQHNSENHLEEVLNNLNRFSDQCLEFNYRYTEETSMISHTPKMSNFYLIHQVISACMNVPATEAYECIKRMNELFFPN